MTREELTEWVYAAVTEHRVNTRYEGAWLRMDCPECEATHGKTGGTTFGVNVQEGWYHCFRCAVRGRCQGIVDDSMAMHAVFEKPVERPGLPWGFLPLQGNEDHEDGRQVLDYMLRRGFPIETLHEAMVGFTERGKYRGRAIIPVWTWDNFLGGFSARKVDGFSEHRDTPEGHIALADSWNTKYLYPPGMLRTDIYLAEELKRETDEPLLVGEGCPDAMAYWCNAIATMGKPTGEQLRLIAANARRPLVVALDRDAERVAKTATATLRRLVGRRVPVGMTYLRSRSNDPRLARDLGAMVQRPDEVADAAWRAIRDGESFLF